MTKTALPTSPVFDLLEGADTYGYQCRACGHSSHGYAREYQAISAGSGHSCAPAGIASIFSGHTVR